MWMSEVFLVLKTRNYHCQVLSLVFTGVFPAGFLIRKKKGGSLMDKKVKRLTDFHNLSIKSMA
jgi:hypothetical protein